MPIRPAHPTLADDGLLPRRLADAQDLLALALQALAENVADMVRDELTSAVKPAAETTAGSHELLRRQRDAAEACGLAPTEFKRRLKLGVVPANYSGARAVSYDRDVLRLWAISGYAPFDREDPARWTAWLYSQFGLNVVGGRVAV